MTLLEQRLRTVNPVLRDRLRREVVEAALRFDPSEPQAIAEKARLDRVPLIPALTARARPDDGRAWYLLATEAKDTQERERSLRRALQYWPDGALAHAMLASLLASTGRPREALPLANRAVDLAPWSADAVSALAGVAVELGKCREALVLQARAAELAGAHGVSDDSSAKEMKARVATYRQRCPAAP